MCLSQQIEILEVSLYSVILNYLYLKINILLSSVANFVSLFVVIMSKISKSNLR